MNFVMIYVTAANRREAARMGRILVNERLAACVNILGRVTSFYRWEGKVQQGGEVAFIAKTRATCAAKLIKRIRSLHSYRVPCVVSIPIKDGHPAFLKWIAAETGKKKGRRATR